MRHRVSSAATLVYSGSRPRKVVPAVAVPPQAYRESQAQTKKTKKTRTYFFFSTSCLHLHALQPSLSSVMPSDSRRRTQPGSSLRESALATLREALATSSDSENEAFIESVVQLCAESSGRSRYFRSILQVQKIFPIADLPDHLLEAALLLVDSVEAVLRCAVVCKAWHTFITDRGMDSRIWRRLAYSHGITNLTDRPLLDATLDYMRAPIGTPGVCSSYGIETLARIEDKARDRRRKAVWRKFMRSRMSSKLSFGYTLTHRDTHAAMEPENFELSLTVREVSPAAARGTEGLLGWSGRSNFFAESMSVHGHSLGTVSWGAEHSGGDNPGCRGCADNASSIGLEFDADCTKVLCFQVSAHPSGTHGAYEALVGTLLHDFRGLYRP